jgi:hypothetical protein
MTETLKQAKWLTVRQLITAYPCFTAGAIRAIIHIGKTNGFDRCVVRIGRKVLIDVKKFEEWVTGHKG